MASANEDEAKQRVPSTRIVNNLSLGLGEPQQEEPSRRLGSTTIFENIALVRQTSLPRSVHDSPNRHRQQHQHQQQHGQNEDHPIVVEGEEDEIVEYIEQEEEEEGTEEYIEVAVVEDRTVDTGMMTGGPSFEPAYAEATTPMEEEYFEEEVISDTDHEEIIVDDGGEHFEEEVVLDSEHTEEVIVEEAEGMGESSRRTIIEEILEPSDTDSLEDITFEGFAPCLDITEENEEELTRRLYSAMYHALDAFDQHEVALLEPRPIDAVVPSNNPPFESSQLHKSQHLQPQEQPQSSDLYWAMKMSMNMIYPDNYIVPPIANLDDEMLKGDDESSIEESEELDEAEKRHRANLHWAMKGAIDAIYPNDDNRPPPVSSLTEPPPISGLDNTKVLESQKEEKSHEVSKGSDSPGPSPEDGEWADMSVTSATDVSYPSDEENGWGQPAELPKRSGFGVHSLATERVKNEAATLGDGRHNADDGGILPNTGMHSGSTPNSSSGHDSLDQHENLDGQTSFSVTAYGQSISVTQTVSTTTGPTKSESTNEEAGRAAPLTGAHAHGDASGSRKNANISKPIPSAENVKRKPPRLPVPGGTKGVRQTARQGSATPTRSKGYPNTPSPAVSSYFDIETPAPRGNLEVDPQRLENSPPLKGLALVYFQLQQEKLKEAKRDEDNKRTIRIVLLTLMVIVPWGVGAFLIMLKEKDDSDDE